MNFEAIAEKVVDELGSMPCHSVTGSTRVISGALREFFDDVAKTGRRYTVAELGKLLDQHYKTGGSLAALGRRLYTFIQLDPNRDYYDCGCGEKVPFGSVCDCRKDLGIENDDGKPRYGLVPPEALEEVVKVFTHEAKLHGARNWEKGLLYGQVYDAAQRHLNKFWKGTMSDDESGLHHLSHAICELFFLLTFELRGMSNLDDRRIPSSSSVSTGLNVNEPTSSLDSSVFIPRSGC